MTFLSYPKSRSLSIIDLIVLASYYFFSIFLFLSLTGLFRKEFIAIGFLAGFLFFLIFFRKNLEFKKYCLYFFIIIPIILAGIILIKGYFAGMGMNFYLPWAREIVLRGEIPSELVGVYSRMPLMPLFYAGIFSFFGFSHWVIAILPFFFATAAALLVYLWLSEKGISQRYSVFGVLLLLASPIFLETGFHPLQEPFILFFAAAFFYYLEKKSFGMAFLSAVLALASKESGIILLLPLGRLFIKEKLYLKKPYCYLCLLFFPVFLWLARNYIIFDNPFFPSLNEFFRGRYYEAISASNYISGLVHDSAKSGIFADLIKVPGSYITSFFSLAALSFYGFFKQRKIQYIFLLFLLLFFVIFVESQVSSGFIRYSMPLLPLFAVYAILGLQELKSRIFLSLLFFINLWGLFSTKLFFSPGQYILPVKFINDYSIALAFGLGLYFYFFISRQTQFAKYLVLFSACFYFARAEVFHLGRWPNIFLPIFVLILIILLWKQLLKLKEETLVRLLTGFIAAMLVFNGWGMALAYFAKQGTFAFPNLKEAYEPRPEIADQIEKIEGDNRDFYILSTGQGYFEWYRNFKTIQLITPTFWALTDAEYRDDMTAEQINSLFARKSIKYVMYKENFWPELETFFDKIKSRPDLFEPIWQKGKFYLWRTI